MGQSAKGAEHGQEGDRGTHRHRDRCWARSPGGLERALQEGRGSSQCQEVDQFEPSLRSPTAPDAPGDQGQDSCDCQAHRQYPRRLSRTFTSLIPSYSGRSAASPFPSRGGPTVGQPAR